MKPLPNSCLPPAAEALPYRQLSRLATELHVAAIFALIRLVPGDHSRALVLLLLARACLPDWADGRSLRAPAAPVLALPVDAVAASLFKPAETVRRQLQALVKSGLAVKTSTGFALSPDPANAARVLPFFAGMHDIYLRCAEDTFATCEIVWGPPGGGVPDAVAVLARALDIALRPLDTMRPVTRNWKLMLLWIVIGAANIRAVTYDPVLSRRYALESTPDRYRRPVSLNVIAKAMDLPYATAWRQCQTMEEGGLITRVDHGWVVLTANLRQAPVEDMMVSNMDYMVRKLRELVRLGLHPESEGMPYLGERPGPTLL